MDLLQRVEHQKKIHLWWKLREEMRHNIAKQSGIRLHLLSKFAYDHKLLTIDEYRRWWWRSREGIKDPITGEVEPHNVMLPYYSDELRPRVYNVVVVWSGQRTVLHPPVKAIPCTTEDLL